MKKIVGLVLLILVVFVFSNYCLADLPGLDDSDSDTSVFEMGSMQEAKPFRTIYSSRYQGVTDNIEQNTNPTLQGAQPFTIMKRPTPRKPLSGRVFASRYGRARTRPISIGR